MTFKITNSFGPLSEQKLKVHEKRWGKLPSDYRSFLLQYNGGEVEPSGFKSSAGESVSSVRAFLGLNKDKHTDVSHYLEIYKDRIPKRFYPIAFDSFGNLVCISLKEPDMGSVYFWDHELEADEDQDESPESASNLTLLANSFSGFLDSLHTIEPPDNLDDLVKGVEIVK